MVQYIFCPCCIRKRNANKYDEFVEAWCLELPSGFLVNIDLSPSDRRERRICSYCAKLLRNPYLIYLNDGSFARAVHLPSRRLLDVQGRRIWGLLVLDPIPARTILPYPGLLVDEYQLDAVQKELDIEFSHSYAKGGVKGRGKKTVLLGQFSARSPLLCAHFINCIYGTRLQSNAAWGTIRVDPLFRKRYPDLSSGVRDGEEYPGVRVTRDLLAGTEILLKTYGAGYWQRYHCEQAWKRKQKLYPGRLLTPQLKEIISRNDEANLSRSDRNRGIKRLRD